MVNVISWLVTALRPTRLLSALNLLVDGSNSSSELAIARLAVTHFLPWQNLRYDVRTRGL